jgi:flagellar biogenesis protein FliO
MVGWAAVALGAAVAVLIFCRRFSFAGRAAGGTAVVQVIGRTALSPRHSVYLLRIAGRRLVAVGVCGDRMTTLAEIDGAGEVEGIVGAAGQPGLAPDENPRADRLEASAMPEVGRLRSWLRQARESLPPLGMRGKRCPT